jgi:hypothetical protein
VTREVVAYAARAQSRLASGRFWDGEDGSVSRPSGRLLLYLFNDKTTLNPLVCDHSPVYLTIEAKLRDKFLLRLTLASSTRLSSSENSVIAVGY